MSENEPMEFDESAKDPRVEPPGGDPQPGSAAPPPLPPGGTERHELPPPPRAPRTGATLSDEDKLFVVGAHVGTLLGLGFIAPLVIWLIVKDKPEKRFVTEHAAESLNFQITLLIAAFVIAFANFILCGLAFFLFPVLLLVGLIFPILATVAGADGKSYRYPLTFRFLGGR